MHTLERKIDAPMKRGPSLYR